MGQDAVLHFMLIATVAIAVMSLRMKEKHEDAKAKSVTLLKLGIIAFYMVFFVGTYYIAKETTIFFHGEFKEGSNHFLWVCNLAGGIVYLPGITKIKKNKKKNFIFSVWQEIMRHLGFVTVTVLGFCTQGIEEINMSCLGTGFSVIIIYLLSALLNYYFNGKERVFDIRDIFIVLLVACFYHYMGIMVFNTSVENVIPYMPAGILVNFIPMLLVVFVTGNLNVALCISVVVNTIWGLIHYFVFQFRGSVFIPGDILDAGTAMTVLDKYQYNLSIEIWKFALYSIILFVFVNSMHKIAIKKIGIRIAGSLIVFTTIFAWYNSDFIEYMDLPYYDNWYQSKMYNMVGYTLGFVEVMKENKVEVPEDYSEERVEEIAIRYKSVKKSNSVTPNIIVIMNEAFADIGDVGKIETNQDYMPYYHSLETGGNIAVGRTLLSTLGGRTSKSEYEFLTGNSLVYNGEKVPYTTEINSDIYTLTTLLKSQGYHTIATHPQKGANWKRNSVYKHMQFDEMHFIEAYEGVERMRGHVTDAAVYSQILSWIEEEKDIPQFVFAVTMQNHGGYEVEPLREGEELPIIRKGQEAPEEVDEYLSLMYETDKALEELIENVEKLDEPTVVVMFGDHFPMFDDEVWNSISGKKQGNSLKEAQVKYATPYLVYANYDVDMGNIPGYMSINYLRSYVLEACGLALTSYDNYLLEMQKQIPAMNCFGILAEDGEWYSLEGELPQKYAERIKEYSILQYNIRYGNASEKLFALGEE